MKLVRFGERGQEKPGMIDAAGALRDLSGYTDDITPAFLAGEAFVALAEMDSTEFPVVEASPRFGVPVSHVGKFICVGLNYADHAKEAGMPPPEEPILFMKATSALQGAEDTVVLPKGHSKSDWEVELGIVIGKHSKNVAVEDALGVVAGLCVVNDLSERAFQLERGGQWVKGKSCDTFGPVGPWLVTLDEVGDPQNLRIWLELNGEMAQDSSTNQMIFPVAELVSYISHFMSLQPGDIISTGTPPGVAAGMKNPRWLKAGDRMRLGIDKLGVQTQQVIEE
ncbi:fumarylacetoacetate hydrolase family protein [Microbulbifer magnicolonia]|uniref:fumarylacetoacetate hydrolase family protein n=1 Tax=Microbulbifer magnicolonia TaxID=3109744 RepID=UPI002B40E4AC|nr:fumarylacetoacetate hydrolase family protein [Microbulbifer sp. GG15]